MNNERGGIISKIFIIPVGVALMVGFFFLGYYVGKYQNKSVASGEIAAPLPEIASVTGRKMEEFTFYKTLTDKNDKTVSIELKPRQMKEDPNPGKGAFSSENTNQAESKQPPQPAKREPAAASTSVKLRYTVQTASFQERAMAEDEVKRLKQRGFSAFIVSSEMPGKGVWHRVRIGSFSNRGAAEKIQKTIHERSGLLTIVVLE
jgi:cell division septation protein DedD